MFKQGNYVRPREGKVSSLATHQGWKATNYGQVSWIHPDDPKGEIVGVSYLNPPPGVTSIGAVPYKPDDLELVSSPVLRPEPIAPPPYEAPPQILRPNKKLPQPPLRSNSIPEWKGGKKGSRRTRRSRRSRRTRQRTVRQRTVRQRTYSSTRGRS